MVPGSESFLLSAILHACRAHLGYALFFSLCSNLLLLALPLYMLQVFDRVLASRSHETLGLLTLVTLGALLLNTWLERLRGSLLSAASLLLQHTAAPAVLARALEPGDASVPRASLADVATLRSALSGSSLVSLFDAPWTPLYLGLIFLLHPWLGFIATAGALLMFAWAWLNERSTVAAQERLRVQAQGAASCADAGIRHRETVHALGMRPALMQHWAAFNEAAGQAILQTESRTGLFLALTRFTRLALQVALLGAGALLVIDHQVSAGVMLTGTLIMARALAPIENAMGSWKLIVEARAAYRRLQAGLQPALRGPAALAAPGAVLLGGEALSGAPLVADRVVVYHDGAAVLKGVSFTLEAGESLGIIGSSGAGKSLLARTLVGVVSPGAGSVRLGGADLCALVGEPDRFRLGYLPQDTRLFPGSVAQNIARLGEIDEAAVVQAARQAGAHEMILRLPRGYQTLVGEGTAAPLPAGQMQRLALARALYGQPQLLVLDEPDAHLDGEAMEQLQLTLRQLRERGASVVVLTHRPSLVGLMDKLLMLRDGQVAFFGPRAAVLARLAQDAGGKVLPVAPVVPAALHGVEKERIA
jgi:PrtD family type I secretion system ABC transporter